MVPIYSWPGVKPRLNGGPPSIIAGTPWRMISMSVAQTAIASTRTSTSAGPGCGTGFSISESSSGPTSTQAFIRSGIAYWLLRERGLATDMAIVKFLSKVRCKLLAAVGLAEDREFLWQAVFVNKHRSRIARCQQNLELGFQAPGLACQLNAVDATRHDDVREQKIDSGSLLENLKGLL